MWQWQPAVWRIHTRFNLDKSQYMHCQNSLILEKLLQNTVTFTFNIVRISLSSSWAPHQPVVNCPWHGNIANYRELPTSEQFTNPTAFISVRLRQEQRYQTLDYAACDARRNSLFKLSWFALARHSTFTTEIHNLGTWTPCNYCGECRSCCCYSTCQMVVGSIKEIMPSALGYTVP